MPGQSGQSQETVVTEFHLRRLMQVGEHESNLLGRMLLTCDPNVENVSATTHGTTLLVYNLKSRGLIGMGNSDSTLR